MLTTEPADEAGDEIKKQRKAGRITTVHLPAKIFGPSRWSGLDTRDRRILNGLVGETTRRRKSHQPQTIREAIVADVRGQKPIVCPYLDPEKEYMVFGGNGVRRGCGYRLVGKYWTGWLHKTGYDCERRSDRELRPQIRDWLEGIGQLAEKLNGTCALIIAGLDPRTGVWFDFAEIKKRSAMKHEWATLDRLHIRVYAPIDYAERLRDYFTEQGGFPEQDEAVDHTLSFAIQLKVRLKALGLRQRDLAEHLGVSAAYVTNLLNGAKWPADRVHQTETWVADHEREN